MSLSVGTDSYVTVNEADELVASYFLSSDATRTAWSEASDSDKEVALRRSCSSINNLKFLGRRKTTHQTMEFPRVKYVIAGVGYVPFVMQNMDNWIDDSVTGSDGMKEVKLAQVVNAAYCLSMNQNRLDQLQRNITGLVMEKRGPSTNRYEKPGSNSYNNDLMIGIYTKEVYHILTPWLSGTYYGI